MSILIFIIVLLVIVLVHEFGHFYSAKRFGIRVDEFGFGFPPKALTLFKKGETEYTLNWLPIGGFVRIFGENPDEESISGPDSNRSFVNKPAWQQAIVLFAGVFMNFILAWVLFSIALGMGSPLTTNSIPLEAQSKMEDKLVVISILPDSPANLAGIIKGDEIIAIASKEEKLIYPTLEDFSEFSNKPGEVLTMTYLRDGKEIEAQIVPEMNESAGRAYLGISPGLLAMGDFGFIESVKYGFGTAFLSARDTAGAFIKLFQGGEEAQEVKRSVVGPVGLVSITGIVSSVGFGYLLSFIAVISISLAVINLVPFPALDGGRLLFLLIEVIKGSRISPKIANTVNMIGFGLLIMLMILITYSDIVKIL